MRPYERLSLKPGEMGKLFFTRIIVKVTLRASKIVTAVFFPFLYKKMTHATGFNSTTTTTKKHLKNVYRYKDAVRVSTKQMQMLLPPRVKKKIKKAAWMLTICSKIRVSSYSFDFCKALLRI